MIIIKLGELLGREKMTRKELAKLLGIRPNTVGDIYNEKAKKIDLTVLDKLCEVFSCNVSDILEYRAKDEETDS